MLFMFENLELKLIGYFIANSKIFFMANVRHLLFLSFVKSLIAFANLDLQSAKNVNFRCYHHFFSKIHMGFNQNHVEKTNLEG